MVAPLSIENPHLVVWQNTLDDQYLVEVQRIDADYANFVIFDIKAEYKEVMCEKVTLGADLGPDIQEWQWKGIEFVDNLNPATHSIVEIEDVRKDFNDEFVKLHMLIHEVSKRDATTDDPIEMLVLVDSLRMTNLKLEGLLK